MFGPMLCNILILTVLIFCVTVLAGCDSGDQSSGSNDAGSNPAGDLALHSPSFDDGGMMPEKHAYRQQNLSPSLQWSNVPDSAKSLALICDDPDAPNKTWVHWVIYNIPASAGGLEEGVAKDATPSQPSGSVQGTNDFGNVGYDGPAPPSGTHRYFFKLYALDVADLQPGLDKQGLLDAMEGHIVAEARLMGRYGAV